MHVGDELFHIQILIELQEVGHVGALKGLEVLSLKSFQSTTPEVVEPSQGAIFLSVLNSS